MSRKLKGLLGFFSFILLSIAVCFYWYYRTENYFSINMNLRVVELKSKLKILRKNNYCGNVENKPDCFQAFLVANEKIKFGADLSGYLSAISTICGEANNYCNFEASHKLLEAIDFEKLWLLENVKTPDTEYKKIYRTEIILIDKFLRDFRKKLVAQYNVELDPFKKIKLVNFVKQIDIKIKSLHF